MPAYQPPAPPVSPCPHCGRAPSAVALLGSDPPVAAGPNDSRRDHYACRCASCKFGYRSEVVRLMPTSGPRSPSGGPPCGTGDTA